jgi:hypothetical protein
MTDAPGDVDKIPRDGRENVVAIQELKFTVEDVEGLFLLGVSMSRRSAARRNRGLDKAEPPFVCAPVALTV